MNKPILDIIEEAIQDMRENSCSCPFDSLPLEQGCKLCKLLFPEISFTSAKCPCNRLGNLYVKAIMRYFFPVKETPK